MSLKKAFNYIRHMDKTQWLTVILVGVLLLVVAIPVNNGTKDGKADADGEEESAAESARREQQEYQEYLEQLSGGYLKDDGRSRECAGHDYSQGQGGEGGGKGQYHIQQQYHIGGRSGVERLFFGEHHCL